MEDLVEVSVFGIMFLIPISIVLHAQPDPVTRIVLGSFYPMTVGKAFGSVSQLSQMLMCVLPHI